MTKMSEKKTSLKVPLLDDLKLEDLRLLKHHEGNPNRMTVKQKEQLWHSLQRYGWLVPIITDADGIVADGEQRVDVCIAHGEFFGPVLRRPLTEAERLIVGQELNKLRGKHNREADRAEYIKIDGLGERSDLESLLSAVGEDLSKILSSSVELGGSNMIPETCEIIIRGFKGKKFDEQAQKAAWEKLTAEGYDAGLLNL